MKKLIIWLFEKYCYVYWVDQQIEEAKKKTMEENNLKNEDELDEYYADRHNAPLTEAYYAGKEDGYTEAIQGINPSLF